MNGRRQGKVKWFNTEKGYGFILSPEGEDVFVHYEAIRGEGYRCLRTGCRVEYSLYQTNKGLQAQDVVQLDQPEAIFPNFGATQSTASTPARQEDSTTTS